MKRALNCPGLDKWQTTSRFLRIWHSYTQTIITCRQSRVGKRLLLGSLPKVNSKIIGIDQFNSNSILELELELEFKDLEQNELNWNWIKRNWASDIFVMLRRTFYRHLGVCLMTKKSWTMKLLVKHYPATNQHLDETDEWEVIRLGLVWMSAGWGLLQKAIGWFKVRVRVATMAWLIV